MQSIVTVNFFAFIIFILNIFYAIEFIGPSFSLAVVSSIFFSFFMIYFLISWPMFFFLLLFFTFSQYTSILSNVYLESGAYALEVDMETFATGSTLRLVTINFAFIFFAFYIFLIFDYFFHKYKKDTVEFVKLLQIEKFILYFILFLAFVMFIQGCIHPFPLLGHIQRFAYWDSVPLGSVLSKVFYFLSYTSLVLAFYVEKYRFNKQVKIRILFLSSFVLLLAILYSNKFSWLSNFFMMWILGYATAKYSYNRKIPIIVIIKKVFIIFPFVVGLVIFSYYYIHGYTGSNLVDMLVARIFSLQGQMWWAIDYEVLSTYPIINIEHLYIKYDNKPSGIFLLMEQVTPPSVFNQFYENKIPFTLAYPAITLYSIGYLGSIISQLFFASYWMLISLSLVWSLHRANPVTLLLSIFLFAAMLWAMLLGSTYVLFTTLNLSIFFLLSLAYVLVLYNSLKLEKYKC